MKILKALALLPVVFITYATADDFKAEAPKDYKDKAKYGFGSLIKGKNAALRKYFDKKSDASSEEKNEIKAEKTTKEVSKKEKLWHASLETLRDFPLELMDKKRWKIETEKVKVNQFDNTGECSYKIVITITSDTDVDVKATSNEDSKIRLKKHEETIKNKILAKAKE
ncbi:MAG: hypothetical protein LBM19_02185 [Holosporales bacterium]|jgi:hypothetical protein|nr:hypothetical protein [Holosporales bacterium]